MSRDSLELLCAQPPARTGSTPDDANPFLRASMMTLCSSYSMRVRSHSAPRPFESGRVPSGGHAVPHLTHAHAHVSCLSVTDFGEWGSRLHCFGLDFRDLAELERFCAHVKHAFTRLDIIINNACQTIRRPPQYYEHLLVNERADPSERAPAVSVLLENNTSFRQESRRHAALLGDESGHDAGAGSSGTSSGASPPAMRVEILRVEEEDVGLGVNDASNTRSEHRAAHVGVACAAAASASPATQSTLPSAFDDGRHDGKTERGAGGDTGCGGGDRCPRTHTETCTSIAQTCAGVPSSGRGSGGGRGDGQEIAQGQGVSKGVRRDGGSGMVAQPNTMKDGGAAEMSQLVVLEEDLERDRAAFPAHKRFVACLPPFFAAGLHSRERVWLAVLMIDTLSTNAIIYPTEFPDCEAIFSSEAPPFGCVLPSRTVACFHLTCAVTTCLCASSAVFSVPVCVPSCPSVLSVRVPLSSPSPSVCCSAVFPLFCCTYLCLSSAWILVHSRLRLRQRGGRDGCERATTRPALQKLVDAQVG
jgi:hypothetical protein